MTDEDDVERWVSVAEASELSGIRAATIRQWYRSGRIPTQRSDGDHGAFLVPLATILRFGEEADVAGDDLGDPVLDLNASYWSLETAAARAELEEVRAQLTFLREQLAEASAAERAATKRADELDAELAAVRERRAATSSITDTSWLELSTERYESPVRSQGSGPAPVAAVPAPTREVGVVNETDPDADAEAKVEHPRPGEHADDLLPSSDKRARRGRR